MTNVDSQRIREIRDNTKAMAEAFSSIANTLADALELFIATQAETQNSNLTFEKDECAKEYEELGLKELKELIEAGRKTEPMKTTDYCDVCNHKGCDNCIADGSNPYCVPSQFEQLYEVLEEMPRMMQIIAKEFEQTEPQTDCSWK